MKTAIIQCADTGPLESLVMMLHSVGYQCYIPSEGIKTELRKIGCDCVLDISGLVENWGYSQPQALPIAPIAMMQNTDLYVDVKAHRSYDKVVTRWPNLKNKVLWYRINGGEPEHVIKPSGEDCGDEVCPPCPILTPNLWYGVWCKHGAMVPNCYCCQNKAYAMWPPFAKFSDYMAKHGRLNSHWDKPVCLIHNLAGWGYQTLIQRVTENLGVRCYGRGSPDGLIPHSEVAKTLSTAICSVHLKSSDAPGYSLYESLAAACPLVVSRRLIWRNRMDELFIPGETCLVFDQPTHAGLTEEDAAECEREIADALQRLSDPITNKKIGMAGRDRLLDLMWNETDIPSLAEFMQRTFP